MRTYLSETALGLIAAIIFGSVAFAGPFGLPDHQQDGYRDTGCDPAQQVQITNDAGEYLYSNNPTCPMVGGSAAPLADLAAAFPAPDEDDEEPGDEDDGECKGGCEVASE